MRVVWIPEEMMGQFSKCYSWLYGKQTKKPGKDYRVFKYSTDYNSDYIYISTRGCYQ